MNLLMEKVVYPANQELEVRKKIAKIKESALASRVNLKVFDIYNVMMTLLKDQKKYHFATSGLSILFWLRNDSTS